LDNDREGKCRVTGTYIADFSVSPAHLDLDMTVQEPEDERGERHKFETIIKLVDANTLHMGSFDAKTRPKTFDDRTMVWHRQ
jgi:hypothetical protein